MTKEILYTIHVTENETVRETFGYLVSQDRKGRFIFTEVGTNNLLVVDSDTDFEEVLPYTVGVKFIQHNGRYSESTYHFTASEGAVDLNDIVVYSTDEKTALVKVVALDTKSRLAAKELQGVVLQGKTLKTKDENIV